MASAFNLTAQLNLVGPTNVGVIIADIRRQLGTINGNIKFQIDPSAIANTARLNRGLLTLNSTLDKTGVSARNAVSAIRDLGKAVTSIGGANSAAQAINNAAKATSSLQNTCQQAAAGARGAGSEMQEFGKQAGLAVRRFSAFSIVTSAIFAVTGAMKQGIAAFIEFDQQFVKLRQVTGESAEGLKGLASTITSLSTGLGASSAELTNVASTLAQAGLSARDTERALKALALSSLAPSFSDMNQTVEGSIALMRQFGISAKDLESSLGAINSVSAKFAVESRDIIAAIQRTGGVFASASRGVSEGKDALNEFIAVFTSVRATTRESAETIATGLRTIFTRIQRGGTIEALKEYGVNLTDLDGKFVGAYKAVQLLSEGLNNIDPRDLKFSEIIEQLGGFRQIGKVIPLIQQFATTQDALKVAQQGQGSLAKDAALAQLSLANQVSKVREEFLALFREIGGSDTFQTMAKGALSVASAIIKVADSMKGVLPVLAALIAMKGASAIFQFGTGFAQGVGRSGGARGLGSRVGGGGMAEGGVIRAFARGGVVPGSGSGDTVPAMLEPGEFVIRKRAVQSLGSGNLHRMNKSGGGRIKKFAAGGKIIIDHAKTSPDDTEEQAIIGKHIANSVNDLTEFYGGKGLANRSTVPSMGQYASLVGIIAEASIKQLDSGKVAGDSEAFDLPFGFKSKGGASGLFNLIGKKNVPIDIKKSNDAKSAKYVKDSMLSKITNWYNKQPSRGPIDESYKAGKLEVGAAIYASGDDSSIPFALGLDREDEKKEEKRRIKLLPPRTKTARVMREVVQNKWQGGEIQKFSIGGTAKEIGSLLRGSTIPDEDKYGEFRKQQVEQGLLRKVIRQDYASSMPPGKAAAYGATRDFLQEKYNTNEKIKAARLEKRIADSTQLGLVGLFPIGHNKTKGPFDINGRDVVIHERGLGSEFEKEVRKMQAGSAAQARKFAAGLQRQATLGGLEAGEKKVFDFDDTLVKEADIFDTKGNIDIPGYSNEKRVKDALQKGKLTALGVGLRKRLKAKPELLANFRLLTARPQSNAALLSARLAELGLDIPVTKIKGMNGGDKSKDLGPDETLVDDNVNTINKVRKAGKTAIEYARIKKGLSKKVGIATGQANIEGAFAEQAMALIGAPILPEAIATRAIDYPNGLGAAASYFPGIGRDWPTEVKRTIDSDSRSKAKEEFTKYLFPPEVPAAKKLLKAKGMAGGGKVGLGGRLGQQAYDLIEKSGLSSESNSILQFANSAGYNLEEFKTYLTKRAEQKRSKAGIKTDPKALLKSLTPGAKTATASQLTLAEQLKGTPDAGYRPIPTEAENIASARQDINNAMKRFALGGLVELYHGSNTGVNDNVLKSFKEKGALSNIAQGYGQGAGFYLYTEKNRAIQQAKMRVGGGSGMTVAQGDKSGKPMVLSFNEMLDPKTYDLDYELQKNLVTQWLHNNFATLKDKVAPDKGIAGIKDIIMKDTAKGIMSSGIKVQSAEGSRKTIYAGGDADLREAELIGQIMNRLQAGDPELIHAFEKILFQKPLGLALKYVGLSALKPSNIETFAMGGRAGISSTDTVPAMLTPGEFVINKTAAKNIGYGKLRQMNHADKVQGFAKGGTVGNIQKFADGDYVFSDTISKSSPAAEAAMEALIAKLVAQITKASPGISVADARKQATEQTTGPVSFGLKTAAETGDQKAAKLVYEAQRKQVVAITKEIRSMDKSISVSDARIAAEAKVGDAWGGLMTKIKSAPMPKGPAAGTPTDEEKADALDRKRARNQRIGMAVGMAIPLATSMITTDKPQSENDARNNALVSGASSSLGAASALAGQGGVLGWTAAIGVGVYGIVQSFADAENAANEFAKTQASSKLEAANEKATASLELFGKNLKDGALEVKATSDVFATIKAADTLASTKDRTYRGVVNLGDRDNEKSAQRGEILKREGILSYLSTRQFFGGAKAKDNLATASEKYIPEMSRERAKDYSSASQSSTLLLESKIKNGESIATLKQQPLDFSNLTKSLALADSAVQESILTTQNRTDIGIAEKTTINQALIARVAENKARDIQTRVLREKAIENLNKSANTLSNSLERMFQTMEQSINKSSFNIERLGHQADLTSAALSGTAKIGSTQLNAINVLQNPRVSSSKESNNAIKLASSAYGPEANNMAGIMKLAISLEDTMMKSINSTLKTTNKSDTNEAVGAKLQSAIAESIANLQLPPDLSSKLAAEVGASVAEIRKSGDSKLDFSQLIEKIPMLGKVIDSSKRSFEAAIKILEHWQKAFTEYSNSLNKIIDIEVDNANRLRTANALVFNGLLELNKALGKTASIATIQRSVSLTTQSMTGGATTPADIGRNIRGLENQRKAQQGASNAAAEAKDVGGFKLMQDGLVKTGVALRQNYEALKHLSESTVVASAAMAKISELQQKNQAGVNIVEKLVTSSPEDLQNLNRSMVMLTNNMQGRVNLGSTAEDRKGSLDAFQMIAPLLGENQNKMKANVLEAMLQESGMGNSPMMNDILASLRNPAVDPAMAEAIGIYKDSLEVQRNAHAELINLNKLSAENTAQIAAEQLKTALEGTPLTFENQQLVDIAAGIKTLVEFGKPLGQAQGKAVGGLIYASGGQRVDFKPQGTDTVPAMLTPGEFVINKAATSKNLPLLKSINSGFSKGGSVGYYSAGGYVFENPWHHKDKGDAVRQAKTPDKQTVTSYPKIDNLNSSPNEPMMEYMSAPSSFYASSKSESGTTGPFMILNKQSPKRQKIDLDFHSVAGYGYDKASTRLAHDNTDLFNPIMAGNEAVSGWGDPYNAVKKSLVLPPPALYDYLGFGAGKQAPILESESNEYLSRYKAIYATYFEPIGDVKVKNDKQIISNSKNIYLDPQEYLNDPSRQLSPMVTRIDDTRLQLSGLSGGSTASDLLGLSPAAALPETPSNNALGFATKKDFLGNNSYAVVAGTTNMQRSVPIGSKLDVHPGARSAKRLSIGGVNNENVQKIKADIEHRDSLSSFIKILEGDKFSSVTQESESNIGFINKLRNLYGKVSPFETFKPTEINNGQAGTEDTSLYNMGQVEWDKIIKKISSDKSIKAYAKNPTDYIGIMPVDPMGPSAKFPWASPNIDKESLEQHQDAFKKRKLIKLVAKNYDDGNGTMFTYNQFEGANGPEGPLYDTVGGFFDTNQTDSFSIMSGERTDALRNPFAEANLDGQDIILSPFLDHAKMGMLIKQGRANWATVKWPVKKKISGVTGYDAVTNENAYPTGAASTITDLTAPKFWDAYDARKIDARTQELAKGAEEQQTRGFDDGLSHVRKMMADIRNLNSVKKIIQKTVGSQIAPIRGAGFNLYPLSNIEKLGTYASDLNKLQTVFGQKIRTKRDKSGKTIGVNEAQAKTWGVIGAASESFTKIFSKDFHGLSSLLNLNTDDFDNQKTPYKIDRLSNSINQYGGLLSSSAMQKITTNALLDQDLEAADKKTVESMFADKEQSDQMRMGQKGSDGKITYRPMNAEDSPKTLRDLGAKALNPYSTFGDGQRIVLLKTLFAALKQDNATQAMIPDFVKVSNWLIEQDRAVVGGDSQTSMLLADPQRYQETALALRRLTLDELGILPDFAKIVEMSASYRQAQKKASGGMIYASGGQMIDFSPKGTDTVPAMLTPGEFVINKAATAKNLPLLQSINRNAGGMVYLAQGGLAHLDGGGEASRYLDKDVARLLRIGERVATRTGWTLETNNNADTTLGLPDVTEQEFQLGQKRRPEMDSDEERGLKVYQESQLKKQEMAAENNAIAKDEAARQEREDSKLAAAKNAKAMEDSNIEQAKRHLEENQATKDKATAFDAETEGMKAGWAATAKKEAETDRLLQEKKDARKTETDAFRKKSEEAANNRNSIAREAKEEQEAVMADKRTAAENSYHIDPVTGKMYETASGALINQQKVAQDILALQKATNNGNIGKKPKVKEATYSDGSHHGALALAEWEIAAKKKQELADLLITQGGMNKIKTSFDAELAQYIASTDVDYKKYKQLYEANKLKPNQAIDYSIMGIRRGVNPNQLPAGAQASSRLRESLDAQNIKRIAEAEHNKIKQDTRDEIAKGPQFTRFTGALANKAGSATASGVTSLTGSEMAGTVVGAAANVGTRLVTSILDPSQYVTPGLGMLTNTAVGAGSLVGAAALAANAGDLQGAQGALAEAAISAGIGVAARGISGPAVKAPKKYGDLPPSLMTQKPKSPSIIPSLMPEKPQSGTIVGAFPPLETPNSIALPPALNKTSRPPLRSTLVGEDDFKLRAEQPRDALGKFTKEDGSSIIGGARKTPLDKSIAEILGDPRPYSRRAAKKLSRSSSGLPEDKPAVLPTIPDSATAPSLSATTMGSLVKPNRMTFPTGYTPYQIPPRKPSLMGRLFGKSSPKVTPAATATAAVRRPTPNIPVAGVRPNQVKAIQEQVEQSREDIHKTLSRYGNPKQKDRLDKMMANLTDDYQVRIDKSIPKTALPAGSQGSYTPKKKILNFRDQKIQPDLMTHELSHGVQGAAGVLTEKGMNDKTLASIAKEYTKEGGDYETLRNLVTKKGMLNGVKTYSPKAIADKPVELFTTLMQMEKEPAFRDNPIHASVLRQVLGTMNLAKGGMIYAAKGQMINFEPKGTDTVPAMLTPGEFVINKAATAKNLPLLQSINRNTGGMAYLADGGEITKPKKTKPKTELQIAREAKQAEYQESKELRRTSYQEEQQSKRDMYQGDKELARLEYAKSRPGSTGTYEEKQQERLGLAERLHTIGKPYEGSQPVNAYIADEIARLKKLDDTALPAEYQNDLTTLASKQKELTDLGEILNKKRLLSAKDQKYATDLSGHLQLVVNGFETIWSTMREKSGKGTPGWLEDMNTKAEPAAPAAPVAAARGGMIYANNGSLISARSQSAIDSIPAMLTPGEFVVNQRATQQNLPILQRLNSGGVVSPNYYANAGEVASQGGSGGSSSGIADLIGGAVSQFTASLTKVLDTYSVASNGGKNSPMATSQEVSSDGVKVDYDTIGAFTAKLANIAQVLGALDKIPDHITISGTHSVEVIINGDEALSRLSPGVQGIVTAAINTAMKKLVDDNPSLQGSVDVPKQK